MKKTIIGVLSLFLIVLFSTLCFAAGTVTVTQGDTRASDTPGVIMSRTLTFTCTGDSGDGTIPNTATDTAQSAHVKGWYLYRITAFPTSGGTAPDAASVFILNANSLDLLGSEDGSTTAYNGLNLIHATLPRTTMPNMYIPRAGAHNNYYPEITGVLTLKVSDQATASANWTIVLTFVK